MMTDDPPKSTSVKQVFISHAQEDADFAQRLADDFKRLGVRVWIAPESVRPGEGWVKAIERGLSESSHVLVVLTPAARESKWVDMETEIAIAREREGHIEVLPLDVKPCQVSLLLSRYQMVDFRQGYDAGLGQLADRLGLRAKPPESEEKEKPQPIGSRLRLRLPMVVLGLLALVIGVVVVGLFVSGLVGGSEKRAATPRPQPPAGASLHNTWKRSTDEKQMVYVPDGTFEMGSTQGHDDEQPLHAVTLDGFWIDRTEVTNSQYARCVADGACSPPGKLGSGTRDSYYGKDEFGHYPVINVTWDDSDTYCQWAGGRLPTEAEWEYAARGPDSLTFPWGNDLPDDTLLNYNENVGDTTQVGAYPGGASWVGAMDMAGNVGEWVADWYAEYPSEAQTNPKGPKTGDWRLMRGGSWDSKGEYVRAAYRNFGLPVIRLHRLGFRCVVEPGN